MTGYDVIVIGTGTAGQTAAYELHAKGLKVAVVEKSIKPGGTCALAGCQAKKWFYEGVEIIAKSHHLRGKGILSRLHYDWSDFLKEKNEFTNSVPGNTLEGFAKAGIDFIAGLAHFLDEQTLQVDNRKIFARFFIIASGAHPVVPPIDGVDQAISSEQFLQLPSLPDRFIFIGGGFISFEFAHFVARLAQRHSRQVDILESSPRPLKPFDAEMVSLLVAASRTEGINLHTGVEVSAIKKHAGRIKVITVDGVEYGADIVVNAVGRTADIEDLDLDRAGIDNSRKGILVNSYMQTSQPHIYAVGDCAATIQLARVADYEAMVAASMIFEATNRGSRLEMNYATIPAVLFTYPQYAMVGYTEDALKQEAIPYKKSFGQNIAWPTYRRIGMSDAAFKILAGTNGQFLGAHILSDNASGIINTIRLAMVNRISVETLYQQSILSPYPSRESDLVYMLKPLL